MDDTERDTYKHMSSAQLTIKTNALTLCASREQLYK